MLAHIKKISVLIFILCFNRVFSQEIQGIIKVDAELIQTQDKSFFRDMESNITQFVNQRRWTSDKFGPTEKVKATFNIKLEKADVSTGRYEGSCLVQFSRPVYNSSYETMTLSFFDKDFDFDYTIGQTLDYNDNAFITNISSMIAFYIYIGLGQDYDSFSKLGGNTYFEKANLVVTNAQNAPNNGWRQIGNNPNSRYWLIENFMSPTFKQFREATYTYYRQGMDSFVEKPEEARGKILEALASIKDVHDAKPNATLIRTYFNSKDGELIKIFSDATPMEKTRAIELLKAMDPTNTDNYEKIMK